MNVTASTTEAAGLHVYLARPDAPATGGVLLLPAANGLGAGVRRCADEIAEAGLVALAWDPFHGRGVEGLSWDELRPMLGGITDADALAEQRRLVEFMLSEMGLSQVGVIGWCFGGRLALVLAAREPRLAACVAYHPSIREERGPNQTEDAIALAREIRCPVQLVHPGADQVLTPRGFASLRAELESREQGATLVHLYPGAEHGFMERPASEANRAATRLAWPQTLAFLRAALA